MNISTGKKDFIAIIKFVKDNQKSLTLIISVIVLLTIVYFSYQKLYLLPREMEAAEQMYVAQDYWNKQDWDKAIKGHAGYPGLEKIISDYSSTKAANLAYYCLGVALLHQGKFRQAIKNLSSYRGNDDFIAVQALGNIGDAYIELKEFNKAISCFRKAAAQGKNSFTAALYLKKLGLVYERQHKNKLAVAAYKKIQSDYPNSQVAANIDKYIARAKAR